MFDCHLLMIVSKKLHLLFAISVVTYICLNGRLINLLARQLQSIKDLQFTTRTKLDADQMAMDSWYEVNSSEGKVYVYSAFLDERLGLNIRIIAALKTGRKKPLYCNFGTNFSVRSTLSAIPEGWDLKYSAYLITCMVPQVLLPSEVQISESNIPTTRDKRLAILKQPLEPTGTFALCVKPLHFHYDQVLRLVEFIELHRLLGVEQFYFYNHSIGKQVEKVLTFYQKQGLVTVLQWQLNLISQVEIRTEGMFAALNDCLYRTMLKFEYVLMVDLDEFIIPHNGATYGQMMERYYSNSKMVGSFSFRNAFFYLYWENDTEFMEFVPMNSAVPYLLTLYKTKRAKDVERHATRSKFIVRPENVVIVGNHKVWMQVPGSYTMYVPPRIALCHHYRICEFGGFSCTDKQSVIDRSVWRHSKRLIVQVKEAYSAIFPEKKQYPVETVKTED